MGIGHHDFTSSEKPAGISLFWKGRIINEVHHEPHLSEQNNSFKGMGEIAERVVLTRGQVGEDVNEPLVPLMPSVKRHKDNNLAMFLEGQTLHNKTRLVQEGIVGNRFGEGADSSTAKPGKWKEPNRKKDDGITNPSNEF